MTRELGMTTGLGMTALSPVARRQSPVASRLPLGGLRRLIDGMLRAVMGPRDDRRVAPGSARTTTRIDVSLLGFFVILLFDVHAPHVVPRAARDVLGRQHRGIHR